MDINKIYISDCRKMDKIEDESVHLIVTSPPYWFIKDYGNKDQIGFGETFKNYIDNLNLVWKECYRVLHKGCWLCINIGDAYTGVKTFGRHKVVSIQSEIIRGIEDIGRSEGNYIDYMGSIIWKKISNCHPSGGASVMGSYPTPRNPLVEFSYEYILMFRKYGKSPKSPQDKSIDSMTLPEWRDFTNSIWTFPGAKQGVDGHYAVFPEAIPHRLIRMFSFSNEIVLDPFMGSGTTALACINLNRNFIGYEINEDYKTAIINKLKGKVIFE